MLPYLSVHKVYVTKLLLARCIKEIMGAETLQPHVCEEDIFRYEDLGGVKTKSRCHESAKTQQQQPHLQALSSVGEVLWKQYTYAASSVHLVNLGLSGTIQTSSKPFVFISEVFFAATSVRLEGTMSSGRSCLNFL